MHLLFDRDGTLTDSREGVVRCLQYALEEMAAPRRLRLRLRGVWVRRLPTRSQDCWEHPIRRSGMLESATHPPSTRVYSGVGALLTGAAPLCRRSVASSGGQLR